MTIPAADRVANTALRRARLALGLSQDEFARAVRAAGAAAGEPNSANKRLVQKWESGEHAACRPNYARALQAVTGISSRELGLSWTEPGQAHPESEDLRWRLAWLGTAPAQDSALRLRVALERPRRARPEEVESLQQLSDRLFALEEVTPAPALLPMAERQLLDTAAVLAGTMGARARRTLTLAGAQTAVVAGRLALDCGDAGAAGRYLDAAMAAARALDDGALWAFVSTYAASVEAHGRSPRYGWHVVQGAVQRTGSVPQVRAWVAVRAAQEAARCGERAAALTNLELVARLDHKMQAAPHEAGTSPWARGIDRAVLSAMAAEAYVTLGDEMAAYAHAERAARLVTGEPVKWRAVVLAEAACSAARLGKSEQIEQWANEAHVLATRLQCTAAQSKLRTLRLLCDQGDSKGRSERPRVHPRTLGGQPSQGRTARSDRS